MSTRDGPYAIFAMAADGRAQSRLTEGDDDTSNAERALLPGRAGVVSGRAANRVHERAEQASFDIYVMRADGTGTRRLILDDRG